MNKRIATSALILCMAGAAVAQTQTSTDVAQPQQTKQTRTSKSEARKRAAEYAAKAGQPRMSDGTQAAIVETGCTPTDGAAPETATKKQEGDPSASQNVVEYGGGGF